MATYLQILDVKFEKISSSHYFYRLPVGELWVTLDSALSLILTQPGQGRQDAYYFRDYVPPFLNPTPNGKGSYDMPIVVSSLALAKQGLLYLDRDDVQECVMAKYSTRTPLKLSVGEITSLVPWLSFPDVILKMTLVHE